MQVLAGGVLLRLSPLSRVVSDGSGGARPAPGLRCIACYQPLPPHPVPVLSAWTLKAAVKSFTVVGWACNADHFHELLRLGLGDDPDARTLTMLLWGRLGIQREVGVDARARLPEVLAASGHAPSPPTEYPPPRPPERDGILMVSPDMQPENTRCLNCLAPNPQLPIATQVCEYGRRLPPDAMIETGVTREADGVCTFKPTLLTETAEKFFLHADGEPVHTFTVYGRVCCAGCAVWAVGAPGGVRWSLPEPTEDLYYATHFLCSLLGGKGLPPPSTLDTYEQRFRRGRWCNTLRQLTLDPFVDALPYDPALFAEQERANRPDTESAPSRLDAVLQKIKGHDTVRNRIKRARKPK
jgi:hypothetical protein